MTAFSVEQISKKLWHINFSDSLDLTMHFFRFSEYYESDTHRRKNIPLIDLIEQYTKNRGEKSFTYMADWAGFNIPGYEIFKRHQDGISDINRYDQMMYSVASYIKAKEDSEVFYIIGTSDDDPEKINTFKHELAHGLFYTNAAYKQKMTQAVNALPIRVKNKIYKILQKWGYGEKVLLDETQAYLSTGLQDALDVKLIKDCRKEFIKIFNTYSKGVEKMPGKKTEMLVKAAKKTKKS